MMHRYGMKQQSKAAQRLGYAMWKNNVSDDALMNCDPASIARSYGVKPDVVTADVLRMQLERSNA